MSNYNAETWKQFSGSWGIEPIYELEKECWAPWLAASQKSLSGRAEVFPSGQLCLSAGKIVLASLSLNRVDWDGDPANLPCWDDVAGDPTDYSQTYVSDGNTLCLMSMNVSPEARGLRLPSVLIESVKDYASEAGVLNVIGSFRPSGYGSTVLEASQSHLSVPTFDEYVKTVNAKGESIDPWLRSLFKNGMRELSIDHQAMSVPITKEEFGEFHQPNWRMIELEGQQIWCCGETGFFFALPDGNYIYKEKNVWGRISNE